MVMRDCEPMPRARTPFVSYGCGAAGGYFRFRFGGARSALKGFLEACIAWRLRLSMVYGDQAFS